MLGNWRMWGDKEVRRRITGEYTFGNRHLPGQCREHADLRAVAVHDHEFVAVRDARELGGGQSHVFLLCGGGHRLAASQQRVATQSDHDTHRFTLP